MIARFARFVFFALFVFTAACGTISPLPFATQPALVDATFSPTPLPTLTPSPTPPVRVLRIWLPPEFDPNADTPAASLLKARLTEFTAEHPSLSLDVRIKGAEGDSTVLDILSLTHSAAPDALPDLVALQRPHVEAAALKGNLHTLDGLTELLNSPDWYPYARQLGHVQNAMYGLPFAGDALVIVYHPSQFQTPPVTWQDLLAKQRTLAYTASEPQGLFVLSLYLSTGSRLLDETNHPFLDEPALTSALQQVSELNLISVISDDVAWKSFTDRHVDLALVWASRFLQDPEPDSAIMPLPGLEGTPSTLATSWSWALAGSDSESQIVAAELAEWLMDDDFLSKWTSAAGYLPTRPNALTKWKDPLTLDTISQSAQALPSSDTLSTVGPILQNALSRVLHGEQATVVAHDAVAALKK